VGLLLKGGEKRGGRRIGKEERGLERRGEGRGGREFVLCPGKKNKKSAPMLGTTGSG